jgi:Protein of unknown function (DUF3429)
MHTEDTARALGYAGLIPFVGLALAATDALTVPGLTPVDALAGLIAYGAIIVSFMAALHWAHALFAPWSEPAVASKVLIWSVIPALAAWVAVWQLPARSALIALAVTLAAILYVDHCMRKEEWFPDWFWTLRLHLTAGAALSLLFAAFV